jgi:putative hydrolase
VSDDDKSPEEQFQEMLRQLLGGDTSGLNGLGGMPNFDPEQLAKLTGMNIDPATLAQLMQQMRGAFASGGDGISWDLAKTQALGIASAGGLSVSDAQRAELDAALHVAGLWLSEATTISELASEPTLITRAEWVEASLPVWSEVAEPVATSIADALTATLQEQLPEEMQGMVQGAGRMMRSIGGSLFATQLGQVVGQLSLEVVSGGDVGIPLLPTGTAAVLPQNLEAFGAGLEIPLDQIALFVAARELAHARLFRHAKWLRLHMISSITEFARGIHVDTDALEDLAGRFDPSRPEELREALESGALLPGRTEAQEATLARLENMLATVEGWVDVVTADATARLPKSTVIAEVVRRRRAAGGPAEQAFSSLVGLQLRPRRLREAAAMWRAITDAVGIEARDSLWDYPDLMPTAADIDDPTRIIESLQARLRGDAPVADEMDDAIARLLAGEDPRPSEGGADTAGGDQPGTDSGGGAPDDRPDPAPSA